MPPIITRLSDGVLAHRKPGEELVTVLMLPAKLSIIASTRNMVRVVFIEPVK